MTISYQSTLSRTSLLSAARLLFRWKASLWKNVFSELIGWTIAYYLIGFAYRSTYFFSDQRKQEFARMATHLNTQLDYIPLTFILGFYVSTIVQRWTVIFDNMGYIERQALFISNYIVGDDEYTRMLRRAMVRYMCLAQVLVYRDISVRVRKSFPSYESLVLAGFLLEHEKRKLLSIELDYNKYWVPISWAVGLIMDARKSGKISSDVLANKLSDELEVFRSNLQTLSNYDAVPVPLVYPQVIMISVYFYFITCLFSRQYFDNKTNGDYETYFNLITNWVPLMTIVQFIFYVGWMKAAEVLLNPMGEDDDDFEGEFLINKNLATSLCVVDDSHNDTPDILPDQFLLIGKVDQIYSTDSLKQDIHPLIGSAVNANITQKKDSIISLLRMESMNSNPIDR